MGIDSLPYFCAILFCSSFYIKIWGPVLIARDCFFEPIPSLGHISLAKRDQIAANRVITEYDTSLVPENKRGWSEIMTHH